MVNVGEATSIVLGHLFTPVSEAVPFGAAVNRVLSETVTADRDLPPCDRVTMDGIALFFQSWEGGQREFVVEGIQPAGTAQKLLSDKKNCIEVMTGAMLPEGTDTVVPYEHIEIKNGSASMREKIVKGQNIHRQGQDAKKASMLLEPGSLLGPAEIAVLAAVGKSKIKTYTLPLAAVISSGDELVDVDATPGAEQVRRSNTYAIQAAMKTMNWESSTFHLPDNKEKMVTAIREIASSHQVIILSGGVSKGKLDFVPAVLEEIGVTKLFHRVNQRPGKPFWFGVSDDGLTVFALPGNPVSTYMCFYRYIKPWFLRSMGMSSQDYTAILATDFKGPQGVTYFLQVNARIEDGKLMACPDAGGGSGDFANLKNVSGFLELPEGRESFKAGEVLPYIPFRHFT